MAEFSVLCTDVDHAECVAWDPAGRLVFGTEAGEIYELDPESGAKRRIATVGGFVLGVAVDGEGGVHACVWDSRCVVRCAADGSVAVESRGAETVAFRTPNYLAFHPGGSLYVSDSGSSWEEQDGSILRIDRTGRTEVVSMDVPAFPNGMAIDPSGSYLYVVESAEPRLSRLPIHEDGSLGRPELLAELRQTVPDGVALCTDGSMVVSCFRPDEIFLVRAGNVETLVDDWQGRFLNSPTNLCFFGADLRRLAAANLGARTIVEVRESGLTGASLHYPSVPLTV